MKMLYGLIAKTEMLFRKPVTEVFEAFINPSITSKFWFTRSSGMLQAGKQICWQWEKSDHSVQVDVLALEENKRILIEWGMSGVTSRVEWLFTPRPDNTTLVSIINTGFSGDSMEAVKHAVRSTEGFALVLAGAKAYLEHNINLNLMMDRFPEAQTG